jgi:hypothetical protein
MSMSMPRRSASLPLACSMTNPAVESPLELLGEGIAAAHVPLVQQPDGGDIGECLAQPQVGRAERARRGPEQVQRADHLLPQPHRQGLDCAEAVLGSGGGERGPSLPGTGEISGGDGLAPS